jgi:DUF1680 family protein
VIYKIINNILSGTNISQTKHTYFLPAKHSGEKHFSLRSLQYEYVCPNAIKEKMQIQE